MSTFSRRRGQLTAAVCVAAAAALLSGLCTPAGAAESAASVDAYVAEHDHAMGSQIRRVEGDQSTQDSRAAASRPQGLNLDGVAATATVEGIDVSGYQGNVDWNSYWGQGKRFAYVKATENVNYVNPYFAQQYNGSYNVGMIRGAYHFATPNTSSGAAQANYFLAHGGGWSGDGKTLPGALDMEYNPYGATCYGLSAAAMTAWIKDFSDTYHARTSKWPAIYTSTSWWSQCVSGDFSSTNPLWVARYASSVGALPFNWGVYTFWQYSSSPIDQDSFNGAYDRLQVFATNHD
ncbi:lysozyme [Amycolatopsis sp. GM8]|uniref:lysozyme n=1 Tax=Amycolatopsis sp. GM8 TaxID=2896530 RepID=UPI001F39A104|nr:lysozyme [Amycolatopsis sp. GM8]